MEKKEILEVIKIHLDEMNKLSGKSVPERFEDIRTVVSLLAELVLPQAKASVSGIDIDFETELHSLINRYVDAGLKKPDLVHKMEYVTQSCRVS